MERNTHWGEWRAAVERTGYCEALRVASERLQMLDGMNPQQVEALFKRCKGGYAMKILSVKVERLIDDSGDSDLGEYCSDVKSEYTIDRRHALACPAQPYNGEGLCECVGVFVDRLSYKFFEPNHGNYSGIEREEVVRMCLQDYMREEARSAGQWCYLGVRAAALVQLTDGGPEQRIISGGLFGIASDSGHDYIKSVVDDEMAELRGQLEAIGFGKEEIEAAFSEAKRSEV